jgi:GDPmannose 4,6-dehydratase
VRGFVERAFGCVVREIVWSGEGVAEKGCDARSGAVLVEIDPRYFRPTEVDFLLGDPSKAHQQLGWRHRIGIDELVREMVEADIVTVANEGRRHER